MDFSLLSDSDSDSSSEEEEEDMVDLWIAHYYQRRVAHLRKKTRNPRKFYNHRRALYCIRCDYLAEFPSIPLFNGREFETMFRVSKSRFERILQDFAAVSTDFYKHRLPDDKGYTVSFEAKVLLPLKTLAFGVPSHTFRDYFQLSSSQARLCCQKFHTTMISVYLSEYLRLPTAADVKSVLKLHKEKHKVKGMMGSLDCMHCLLRSIASRNRPLGVIDRLV